MPGFNPLSLKIFQRFKIGILVIRNFIIFDFPDELGFFLKIFLFNLVDIFEIVRLTIKKLIACRPETSPYFLTVTPWYRPYLLPLFLKVDQFMCGLLPVVTVFQCFCLNTKVDLQVQVVHLLFLNLGQELALVIKECI